MESTILAYVCIRLKRGFMKSIVSSAHQQGQMPPDMVVPGDRRIMAAAELFVEACGKHVIHVVEHGRAKHINSRPNFTGNGWYRPSKLGLIGLPHSSISSAFFL